MVSRMLMKKSALQPRSRKTPRGGRKIARMILQMSEAVKGMFVDLLFVRTVCVCLSRRRKVDAEVWLWKLRLVKLKFHEQ